MAVLPANSDIFSVGPSTGVSKKISAPSQAAVAAIAAGRTPPASNKPAIRRMSSTSSAAANRKANPEKRANHNAIERARRDSLNQRFVILASKLPSISEVRRPSKSLIVNRSLQFVTESLSRETMYRKMIMELHDRTRVLTEQLNEYRIANGLQNFVEPVPELVLPVPQADAPKHKADKPSARTLTRKESASASVDELGDEYDDGAFSLEGLNDDSADLQQGYPLGMPAPTLAYPTPPHMSTDASFFSQSLTGSPVTATSLSPNPDPAGQSPDGSGSPTDLASVMHPVASSVPHSEPSMFPMFMDGGMFDPSHFGNDFSTFLAPSAFPSA